MVDALEALASLERVGAITADDVASAKARLLSPRPVADVRPVGPDRRGRTLAIALDGLRLPTGELRAGAVAWLEAATERFHLAVVLAADARDGEEVVHRAWLRRAGLSEHALSRIRFPTHKPPADVYIDPRAVRFEGVFPDPHGLSAMMRRRQ